ncbi:hypothetical protein Scep_029630 [Stephania cephalantha]|uniref:Uncharacterized protein n=1 Tax=Stephania cephalantha TaxID=152367 RepID=A0AAP0HDN7_9MAGN
MSMQGQAYIPLRRFPYLLPSVVNLFKNSLVSLPHSAQRSVKSPALNNKFLLLPHEIAAACSIHVLKDWGFCHSMPISLDNSSHNLHENEHAKKR